MDLFVNLEGMDDIVAKMTASSERFPLRINSRTVIFVAREKCTPEYAAAYLEKINGKDHCGGL